MTWGVLVRGDARAATRAGPRTGGRRVASRAIARLAALAAALAIVPASAATVGAQQRFHRGHALEPTGSVHVFSTAGTITITGWDRDSVDAAGTVGEGLRPFAGGTRSGYKVTTYEGRQNVERASHLHIRVPRRAQVWVKTTSAAVTVRGAEGAVDVYTISGRAHVDGTPASLTVESMRGDIRVAGATGWLRARSGTGQVRFEGEARDVALSTVSGAITSATRFARGRFESMSGDIELVGPLPRDASADIDTHTGPVTVRAGPRASAAFTVFSVSGRISNELSRATSRPSTGRGRELAFSVGDGTARVTVRTFDGPVVLRER